jgi:hypothetical protein
MAMSNFVSAFFVGFSRIRESSNLTELLFRQITFLRQHTALGLVVMSAYR